MLLRLLLLHDDGAVSVRHDVARGLAHERVLHDALLCAGGHHPHEGQAPDHGGHQGLHLQGLHGCPVLLPVCGLSDVSRVGQHGPLDLWHRLSVRL